jgi:hypothetical protein
MLLLQKTQMLVGVSYGLRVRFQRREERYGWIEENKVRFEQSNPFFQSCQVKLLGRDVPIEGHNTRWCHYPSCQGARQVLNLGSGLDGIVFTAADDRPPPFTNWEAQKGQFQVQTDGQLQVPRALALAGATTGKRDRLYREEPRHQEIGVSVLITPFAQFRRV